jgi:ATP-dependent exoDNAse (exonuclease V) beta subunit
MKACFHKPYAFADRVDLPVKSSASALLRMQDTAYSATSHTLFEEENEQAPAVGTDVGKAYHRYLELCDLSENRVEKIAAQKQEMLRQNLISQEQFDILSDEKLAQILTMDVFQKVKGAQIYREQEFLCRLPANEFLPTSASDGVMVQGAIDLLILGKDGCHIVDYKYSKRSDTELVAAYAKQLDLYKKAVAVVLKVDVGTIRTTLVNIRTIRAIPLE